MLVRIMWCKEREENINKMLSTLPENTEVIWDRYHDACDTLCRVLDTDDSVLVMEDDIELCKWFYERALKEIEKRPNEFIMFYSCKSWEIEETWPNYNRRYVFTQAYYVPAWLGKKAWEFLPKNYHATHRRWSIWLCQFLKKENVPRYLVKPSLVQHIWNNSILEPQLSWERPVHMSTTYKYDPDAED